MRNSDNFTLDCVWVCVCCANISWTTIVWNSLFVLKWNGMEQWWKGIQKREPFEGDNKVVRSGKGLQSERTRVYSRMCVFIYLQTRVWFLSLFRFTLLSLPFSLFLNSKSSSRERWNIISVSVCIIFHSLLNVFNYAKTVII